MKCNGITKEGKKCKNVVHGNTKYCFLHRVERGTKKKSPIKSTKKKSPIRKVKRTVKKQKGRGEEKYKRIDEISAGAYGTIYSAEKISDSGTGIMYAMKNFNNDVCDGVCGDTIAELSILRNLSHPNILELVDIDMGDDMFRAIYPFYKTDLNRLIKKELDGTKKLYDKKAYTEQMLDAMNYLHSHGVIHRDLKPHNILVTDDLSNIIIADFGLAWYYQNVCKDPNVNVVTIWWRAPELLNGELQINNKNYGKQYNCSVDIWSIGCIIYQMVTGTYLFNGNKPQTMLDQIKIYETDKGVNIETMYGPEYKDLAAITRKCLMTSARNRPSARDILKDAGYEVGEYGTRKSNAEITIDNHFIFYGQGKLGITEEQRNDAVEWLFEQKDDFSKNTLNAAILLFDQHIFRTQLEDDIIKGTIGACLLIASKLYDSRQLLNISYIVYICDNVYTSHNIAFLERDVLENLQFAVNVPIIISNSEKLKSLEYLRDANSVMN